jgi:hypothetical protein
MATYSHLERSALQVGGCKLDQLYLQRQARWLGAPVDDELTGPLEDLLCRIEPATGFSATASLRSFNLLCGLLSEPQLSDLFELGYAVEHLPRATIVLDLLGSGIMSVEGDRVVWFCIDPDIDLPRLDRLATKLLWARGDWDAYRAEAVPQGRRNLAGMEDQLALNGNRAKWLATNFRSLKLLSRLLSDQQLTQLGAGRVPLTRYPYVFLLGGEHIGALDLRDGAWSALTHPRPQRLETWSNYWLRHVIALNDPERYVQSASWRISL